MEISLPQTTTVAVQVARFAWAVCILALVLIGCGFGLALANGEGLSSSLYLIAIIFSALVGSLVVSRRPTNPVGWCFLISAVCYALFGTSMEYARYGLITHPGTVPLSDRLAVLPDVLVLPGIGLPLGILPLYFPSGHLLSRRWRPVARFVAGFLIVGATYEAVRPGAMDHMPGVINPVGITALQPIVPVADTVSLVVWLGIVLAAVASIVVRFRRSRGVERLQMKWLTFAVVAWFGLVIATTIAQYFSEPLGRVLDATLAFAFAGIPLAAGIAILRWRLYDIDNIINRTLVYGVLTVCVISLYVFVVGYLGAVFARGAPAGSNLAISLVATGLVAVLFQPLRDRVQRAINQLLYGQRDEPYAVLSHLGQRLEGNLTPGAVLPTIVETVGMALKLPYAAIIVKQQEIRRVAAEYGRARDELLRLPLTYQGEAVGELLLAPRAPGEVFTPADHRLLDMVARQAGVAAHALRLTTDLQQLTVDLQHSPEQLIASREEERRRLRRDLHDGVGPTLASLAQRLDVARRLVERDPAAAATLLSELKGQVKGTLADIRRLVYALRPPVLDEFGLVSAIREHAAQIHQPGALEIVVDVAEPLPPLPAAVEVAAYRIVLEAVTNVVRHAEARECVIRLDLTGIGNRQALSVEIRDDGRGMPDDQRAGVGLTSMRERAQELGGVWEVQTRPMGGTRVQAFLPLSPG